MIDFKKILTEVTEGNSYNPYAAKLPNGDWIEGTISIDFLENNFSNFETASEIKESITSEGLIKYFDYLVKEGLIQE